MPVKAKEKTAEKSEIIEIPVGKFFSSLKQNPWIIATFVLAIILIIVLIFNNTIGTTVNSDVENAQIVGNNVLAFIQSNPQLDGQVSLVSTERQGQLYQVTLGFQGQEVPVYATLDGKFLVSEVVPLTPEVQDPNAGTNPPAPKEISADDDAILGSPDAPVTIVEFSDSQCPFCRKFATEAFPQIKQDYIDTGKVKLVYRDYPLDFHPMALPSAVAAECVREKGGDAAYFKFHDKVFAEQNILDGGTVRSTVTFTEDDLKNWAKSLGYDISSCLDSNKYAEEVQNDFADGQSYGVTGTPAFFVNGVVVEGAQPYSVFKQVIDAELAKVQ